MSEHTPSATETAPQVDELRVAVFDLAHRALISYKDGLSLFVDVQPLNAAGLPGISHERRATNISARLGLDLPGLSTLGRLYKPDSNQVGYAVASRAGLTLKGDTLAQYDLTILAKEIDAEIQEPGSTTIDPLDAHLLQFALQHNSDLRRIMSR